jgi:hypothetical protein
MTVPPGVAVAADSPLIDPEVQAEARYALLGTVDGTTGTPEDGSAVTELTVGVPERGATRFVVGVGSTTDPDGGSWSIRAVSPRGTDQVLATVSRPAQTFWEPDDVSVSLAPWRGQVIQLQLAYQGAVAALAGRPAFVEPRMIQTSAPPG